MNAKINKPLVPRKKFDQKSMIKNVLERAKTHDISGWAFVSRKDLVARFAYDLANSKIWVYGSDFKFPQNVSMAEVLFLFSDLTPEVYAKQKGERQLRLKPVFSANCLKFGTNGKTSEEGKKTTQQLLNSYNIQEKLHKQVESHHPDGQGWITNDSYNKPHISFEVVLDVFASLLRENSAKYAWPKLIKILNSDKFKYLNVKYVYAALMHIMVRGVADTTFIKMSASWRIMTQPQAEKYHHDFENGLPPSTLIAGYKLETLVHQAVITKELNLIRAPLHGLKHDYSKFTPRSVYYYTWRWGVWNNFSDVMKNRALAGCSEVFTDLNCRFTMWSPTKMAERLGSSFASGAASSIAESSVKLDDSLRESVASVMSESATKWSGEVSNLMDEFFNRAESLSGTFWSEFAQKAEQVMGNLKQDLNSVSTSLLSMEVFVQQVQSIMNTKLEGMIGMSGITINFQSIMSALKYYLIYINVENKTMKGLAFLMILESIGCVSSALSKFMQVAKACFGTTEEENEEQGEVEGCSARPTSFKETFYNLINEPMKLIKVAALVMAQVGTEGVYNLTKIDYLKLLRGISTYAKEFHFIGGGVLGIQRIIDAFCKIYQYISAWIKTRILGIEDSKRKIAREVLKWILEVRYFATERGLTAIRCSKSSMDRASKLFSRGQGLLAQVSPASNNYDPKLYMDINRYFREAKLISNFITRRKAVTGFQPTMFHVQFVGQPGIGKSTLTKRFVRDLISNLWKDSQPDDCWAYNPNLEFFDGYTGQKIMIIDDMFRMNEPKHLTTLIGLVTNTPIVLPMANLEDKGIHMTSEILLSSTNTAYPRGKDILCMEAVHRRRHMLVHTEIDPRVVSKSTGQFELALFNQYYPAEQGFKLEDMPHLKFSLLQPVPREADLEAVQELDREHFTALHKYAQKLKDTNDKILCGKGTIDPMFYFSASRAPPSPLKLPCEGWSYNELVSNAVVRFTAFRGMEGRYSKREKYGHVEGCLAEIDMIIDQAEDLTDLKLEETDIASSGAKTGLISQILNDKLSELESPFPIYDKCDEILPDGEDLCPEIADLDIDDIIDEFLSESTTSSDSFDVIDPQPSTSFTGLDLTSEQKRRDAILRRKNKTIQNYAERNQLRTFNIDGRDFISTNSSCTLWDEFRSTQFDPTYGGSAIEMYQLYELIYKMRCKGVQGWPDNRAKFLTEFKKFGWSANLTVPNHPSFGADLRGKKMTLPIEMLRRTEVHNGVVMMDVSDLVQMFPHAQAKMRQVHCRANGCQPPVLNPLAEFDHRAWKDSFCENCKKDPCMIEERNEFITLHHNGEPHVVRPDLSLLFASYGLYSMYCANLDLFSIEQIKILSEYARIRNSYTGIYTKQYIKSSIISSFDTMSSYVKELFSKTIDFFSENFKKIVSICLSALALGAIIYTFREIAKMFYPDVQHTSKFLHRGPPSSIRYQSRFTSSFENEQWDQRVNKISNKNMFYVTSTDGTKTCKSHCLISGQYLFLNKHAIWRLNLDFLTIHIHYPEVEPRVISIDPRNVYMDPEGDLAVIFSRYIPSAPPLRKFLPTLEQYKNAEIRSDVIMTSREWEYNNRVRLAWNSPTRKVVEMKFSSQVGDMVLDHGLMVNGLTRLGRSGSPVFYPIKGELSLIGMQAWEVDAGFEMSIAIQILTKEKYDRLISFVEKPIITREEHPEFETLTEFDTAFTSVSENNLICSTDSPPVGWVCSTQFKQSPIARLMEADGVGSKSVPASLSKYDPMLAFGTEIHPLKHSLSKYTRGSIGPINMRLLSYVADAVQKDFSARLDRKRFRLMNISEIFTGTREDGSNPMNLKSSPGIPYIWQKAPSLKGKRTFVNINEDGEMDFLSEQLVFDYKNFKHEINRGILPLTLSYDFPKDELRPFKKARGDVETGSPPKTRTVTCMNMLYIMLWRELTLDMWASFHRIADGTFPLCPGINPEGPEWNNAYNYLNHHPYAIDFDVSNWDGFLTPEFLFIAGDLICAILKYKKDSLEYRQVFAVLYEVMYGYIQYGTTIYQKNRGMISGFPGTAEMNSLVHYLLIVYIYLSCMEDDFSLCTYANFKENVRVLVYGDDIIITFSELVKDKFNGLTIRDEYVKLGYPVTPADKQCEFKEFKKLLECSFLKSTWRELFPGYMIRKMDMSVPTNLVYWVRAKEHPIDQFQSNVNDSLHLVFGHGEERFNEWVEMLNSYLTEVNLPIISYTYWDLYDDYIHRYIDVDE